MEGEREEGRYIKKEEFLLNNWDIISGELVET
jgi:hypothetical protein